MNLIKINQTGAKYRLGDTILLGYNGAARAMQSHPNTIGHDYMTALKWTGGNNVEYRKAFHTIGKDILLKIIDKHIKKHNYKAPKTETVLHWRFHPFFELERLSKLKETIGDKEVTVCAALHSNETKGLEEFNKFINQDNVRLKSSPNPDEDFCFLFQAKKLILTKGNFGNTLYEIRDKNENTCFL